MQARHPGADRRLPEPLRSRNEALFEECSERGFEHIQAAVDAVREPGTRILIQPGLYLEEPSLGRPPEGCARFYQKDILSYGQHKQCPHAQNLIAILGDSLDRDIACDGPLCNLQVEGTGRRPTDVIVDGRFRRLNVIRADRADGVYFRNFTVQHAPFNALYVMQTDGFVIDRVLGRWNDEYAFLTFASDHGLYVDCEAYGNGDAGVYPGSASDLHGVRHAIEITRCRSHHNALGLSGTAGNSLWVHDNEFFMNTTGVVLDSFFPDHPGLPQDSSTFVRNEVWGNNQDYYRYYEDGTCSRPSEERGYEEGVVCPAVPLPVGTGILLAGGNANTYSRNWVYDNWRYGTMQFWVPASLRGEDDPEKQYDTSHFNRYLDNVMGISPAGRNLPNGLDHWWDEEGEGNCWDGSRGGRSGVSSDPAQMPDCENPSEFSPGDPAKQAFLVPCATWSRENHHPPGCDWMERPPPPER